MNGHGRRLTAQPPFFSAFTNPRMTLLPFPKVFLSHSLCQAIFPSWSEWVKNSFPKPLPLLAEDEIISQVDQGKMDRAPCVRLKGSQQFPHPLFFRQGGLIPQLSPTIIHAPQSQGEAGLALSLSKPLHHDSLTSFSSLTLVLIPGFYD